MMPTSALLYLPHRFISRAMWIHSTSACEHPLLFFRFSNLNLSCRGFGGKAGFRPLYNTDFGIRKLSTHSSRLESQPGFERGNSSASKSLADDESELSDWVSQLNSSSSFPQGDRKGTEGMGRDGFDRDRGGRGFGRGRSDRGRGDRGRGDRGRGDMAFGRDRGGRGFGDWKNSNNVSSMKNTKWSSSSKRNFNSESDDDELPPRTREFRDSKSGFVRGNGGRGRRPFERSGVPRRGIGNSAAKSSLSDEDDSDGSEIDGGRDYRASRSKSTRGNDGWGRRPPGGNGFSKRNMGVSSAKDDLCTDGEDVDEYGSGNAGGFRASKSKSRSNDGWGRNPVGRTGVMKRDIGNSAAKVHPSSDEDMEECETGDGTDFKGMNSDYDSEDVGGDDSEDDSEDEEHGAEDESDESDEEVDDVDNDTGTKIVSSGITQSREPNSFASASTGSQGSYLSEKRFDQCEISPLSLKAIKDAGYEKMTVVQAATLPVILSGKDVLARAKTGTGKTVAFLLPSIEIAAKAPAVDRDERRPPIIVLVICPTRELANQAAKEADMLLKYHPSVSADVVIGGTRLALEQKRMQVNPSQILVATPGRLRDHIENTPGFVSRLKGVKILIFDEADHLLDMGFVKDMEAIVAAVPKHRQTLMFSATFPDEIHHVSQIALRRDHEFINTVQEGSEDTHTQVKQAHLVAPLDKHFSYIYALLKEHIADDIEYKVLVFCITAMQTDLVATLLKELGMNVREIHSRKSQSYRTRVSDEFRKSKGLILVTSDVSARGVDYPDVTLVVQVGSPSDREQYIHRLGRTGRKGKTGQGVLLLAPWEDFFLSSIKDLPLEKAPTPSIDPQTCKKVERAMSQVEMVSKEKAYQSWLGYYNSNRNVGRDKGRLVELANQFSRTMGLDTPPAIPKLILSKMGLKNVPGLRSR